MKQGVQAEVQVAGAGGRVVHASTMQPAMRVGARLASGLPALPPFSSLLVLLHRAALQAAPRCRSCACCRGCRTCCPPSACTASCWTRACWEVRACVRACVSVAVGWGGVGWGGVLAGWCLKGARVDCSDGLPAWVVARKVRWVHYSKACVPPPRSAQGVDRAHERRHAAQRKGGDCLALRRLRARASGGCCQCCMPGLLHSSAPVSAQTLPVLGSWQLPGLMTVINVGPLPVAAGARDGAAPAAPAAHRLLPGGPQGAAEEERAGPHSHVPLQGAR